MKKHHGKIVLASASPRRLQLLEDIGLKVLSAPADIEENALKGEQGEAMTLRLARAKAEKAAEQYPDQIILGADTIVVCAGKILGKPGNKTEGRRMLQFLSGRTQQVITGVCLLTTNSAGEIVKEKTWSCKTEVVFRSLDEESIADYLDNVDILDKAGAYSIQEQGEILVEKITGLRSNVIGLPIEQVEVEISLLLTDASAIEPAGRKDKPASQ